MEMMKMTMTLMTLLALTGIFLADPFSLLDEMLVHRRFLGKRLVPAGNRHDPPVLQERDPVRDVAGEIDVVGDHQ